MIRARLGTLSIVCLMEHRAGACRGDLFLMEPIKADGSFVGTGHVAVYLSRVCAASPVALKRCAPGEWVRSSTVTRTWPDMTGARFLLSLICTPSIRSRMFRTTPMPSFVADLRGQYRRNHLQSNRAGRRGQ